MLLQNVQDEFAELMNTDESQNSDIITPAAHMKIYKNNMIASLQQTLQETYKMIVQLVGEDFFRLAAREYIHRYPSLSGNLHDYGEYFSDFLEEFFPVRNLPYLPEVAKFEWTAHLLHYANGGGELDPKSMESLSPDQFHELHFNLHPASALIQFQYPILRIIDLCKGEMDEEINLDEGGVNLLIIRRELEIMLVPLALSEFTFLSALNKNASLGDALDETLVIDPEFKLDEIFPKWIKDKTIVDFYLA